MAIVAVPRADQEFASSTLVREQASLWRDGLRRLRRNRLALVSAVYLVLLALVALGGALLDALPHVRDRGRTHLLGSVRVRICSVPTSSAATCSAD